MAALLSQRGYAKRRGLSHTAVQKAVLAGRLTTIQGKIDPDVADREWRENTDLTRPKNAVTGTPKMVRPEGVPSAPLPLDGQGASATSVRGYAHARAAREGYLARLAKLEYEKQTGELVSADEVRVTAFNRARRTRDLLMAIPDRVAALLAAESDVATCHEILTTEITRSCEELSRVERD